MASVSSLSKTAHGYSGSDHKRAEFSLNHLQQQPQQKQVWAHADQYVSNEVFILRMII